MAQATAVLEEDTGRHLDEEQQLVLFQLEGEDYGVNIYSVQRLIEVPEITQVPRAPYYVAGVIDVRGDIIPVVNLKRRFGFTNTEVGEKGRIVIVEMRGQVIGLLVDGVSEVTRLARGDIEPPSGIVSGVDTEFIAGIGKQRQGDHYRLIIVLDPEVLLRQEEGAALADLSVPASAAPV